MNRVPALNPNRNPNLNLNLNRLRRFGLGLGLGLRSGLRLGTALGLLLILLLVAPIPRAFAAPAPPPAATNQLVIVCDGGAVATPTNAIWRRNVRAADSQLYLECQELTALLRARPETNIVRAPEGAPRVEGASPDTNRARIDAIIAETDVMIITPELQILGDHAVYTASNDVLRVTGLLVIVAEAHGSTLCTNFTFDRAANVITIVGPQTTLLRESTFSRTNAPGTATPSPPRRTP